MPKRSRFARSLNFMVFAGVLSLPLPSYAFERTPDGDGVKYHCEGLPDCLLMWPVERFESNIGPARREPNIVSRAIRLFPGISTRDIEEYGWQGGPNSEPSKAIETVKEVGQAIVDMVRNGDGISGTMEPGMPSPFRPGGIKHYLLEH